jgi:putative Ca2+/H+ antiporter (TMEM165/GDT1 family)
MQAFFVSAGVVALAEIGDKSQFLVLALAVNYRKPVAIILGICTATLMNHALAGAAGAWLGSLAGPQPIRWLMGLSFLAIGIWTLFSSDREQAIYRHPRFGVFGTTVATFFLMEMGDKTQVATIALAANYGSVYQVVAGSTIGILLADIPVVILATATAQSLPLKSIYKLAPAMFLLAGVFVLLGFGATG